MAIIGFTAALSVNDGAAQAYVAIDDVTMITLPSSDTATVETTSLGTASAFRTYTGALTDSGNLTFECHYSKATYTRLSALVGFLKYTTRIPPSGADVTWKVTAPDEDAGGSGTAQTFTMKGILVKLETSFETESLVKIKGEVKISGGITIA